MRKIAIGKKLYVLPNIFFLTIVATIKRIIKRIIGRQSCSRCGLIFNEYYNPSTSQNHSCNSSFLIKRNDDNEETVLNRYETYLKKTLPILDFYKGQNLLYDVNGSVSIQQIFKEIRSIIASLQA